MALAIIGRVTRAPAGVELLVDSGSNDHLEVRVGTGHATRDGIDRVIDIVHTTPLLPARPGRDVLDTTTVVQIPRRALGPGPAYAQLFTYKGTGRLSPSYSDVVRLPTGVTERVGTLSGQTTHGPEVVDVRHVPCRTAAQELARSASLSDLIGQVVELAGPVVARLLGGAADGTPVRPKAGTPSSATATPQLVTSLLQALLAGLRGGQPAATSKSLPDNRFARPMVFGIDDALIGAVIGQVVSVLPKLANAANQERVSMRQANNQLVGGILADIGKRQMIRDIMRAIEHGQEPGDQGADQAQLNQLLQLLRQVDAQTASGRSATPTSPTTTTPTTPTTTTPTTTTRTQSLDLASQELSSGAVLSFVQEAALPWHDRRAALFARTGPLRQRVRLDVAAPGPNAPLPRAICRLVVKDHREQTLLHEQEVRLNDVSPGAEIGLEVAADDVARLPVDTLLDVCAELRWPVADGRVRRALGSTSAVVVGTWHVAGTGQAVSDARELPDLDVHRAFWNRVWTSPVLDAPAGGRRMLLWELDVALRYTVLLTSDHDVNGVMETRTLAEPETLDTVTARTKGRMKAGAELSTNALTTLLGLWPEQPAQDAEITAVFDTPAFARSQVWETTRQVRLRGKAAESGMVMIGPVLRLVEFPIATVAATDASGQVTEVRTDVGRIPLPTGLRILGMVSTEGTWTPTADDAPAYSIQGYDAEVFDKVQLTQPGGRPVTRT